ncbi:hypothetical protein [Chitinophaga sp. Cy-1792]|uniref:hypothetical protein n=1 Tax=Chitinophaga sp. Cy-1792 TaxID=2608339 RepID=UPI001423C71D|nr:hypothetical protein [Chitinophaga sp. Cy-1792]NIG54448.1 hypothetical protein [Chitinophaga sp. Cy-1792]
MRVIIPIYIAVMLLISCSTKKDIPALRPYAFNDSGLLVITTVINEKAGTVSLLYGNKAAMAQQLNRKDTLAVPAQYTLVTYRNQDNKYWYGSYINGALLRVEQLNMSGQPAYSIREYNSPAYTQTDATSRTDFILSLTPAFYPCDPY